jgi:hypothetical protein
MRVTSYVVDDDTVSIGNSSVPGDDKALMVTSRPPLEILPDIHITSPMISAILPSPNTPIQKPSSEATNREVAMSTMQKKMTQFFEGDDPWEDVDALSNWNAGDNLNGISPSIYDLW